MDSDLNNTEAKKYNIAPWLITILVGAWIIGMSIVAAGWLISKEMAKNYVQNQPAIENPIAQKVDFEVPAGVPVLGDNHAKVTIVEFADFQCPFCGDWQKNVFPELKSQYIDTGKARFAYMSFPFLGEESYQAASAAKCALDQNKFWEYHDKLFAEQKGENEGAYSDPNLKKFALELGLNTTEFNSCLDTKKYNSQNEQDISFGTNIDVQSTPTVFINGNRLEGVQPFAAYKDLIETELAK